MFQFNDVVHHGPRSTQRLGYLGQVIAHQAEIAGIVQAGTKWIEAQHWRAALFGNGLDDLGGKLRLGKDGFRLDAPGRLDDLGHLSRRRFPAR